MGLFSKNWAKELDRAEGLLQRNLPVAALEIAERAASRAEPGVQKRAAAMIVTARQAVLDSVLAKAAAAEAGGDLEDAADWLLAAVEHEPSAVRRDELEARRQALLDRADRAYGTWPESAQTSTVIANEAAAADVEFRYETLITMLGEETRALYEKRAVDFKKAFVDLNEGRTAAALEAFESLAEAVPEDPVVRLERGRARLLSGDPAAARSDFAEAWDGFGETLLDTHTSLLVPALWAEASLAAGHASEVAERLEPLASPATGDPELCRLYAMALLGTGRLDRAVAHLEAVLSRQPGDPDLNLLLAQTLASAGDTERAITGLELAIAPSCAAGGCARPAAHLPSFRLLARLHLEHGEGPERVRELMALVANAQQGHLESQDLEILAAYYEATGDGAAAKDAAAEARRLAGTGSGETVHVDPAPRTGRLL
jgi:tetratricopeptide (TPR) repeat protein